MKRAENPVSGSGAVSGVGEIDMSGERIFWSSAGVGPIVVRERSGTPFRQIFWNRNGAPANIVGQRWNAKSLTLKRSGKSRRTR